jgi:hypothetical protein
MCNGHWTAMISISKIIMSFQRGTPVQATISKSGVSTKPHWSVSFDVTNKQCLFFFRSILDRLKAASYPGLKKGCFPSDKVPNGYLKGMIIKCVKSSNVTSWEVAWSYTVFGNSKVFHLQAVDFLDSIDDK